MLDISDEILKQVSSIKKDYLKARGKIKEDFFSDQKGIKCCKSNSDITDLFIKNAFNKIMNNNPPVFTILYLFSSNNILTLLII